MNNKTKQLLGKHTKLSAAAQGAVPRFFASPLLTEILLDLSSRNVSAQRLIQIPDQIVGCLEADRQTHDVVAGPRSHALFVGQLPRHSAIFDGPISNLRLQRAVDLANERQGEDAYLERGWWAIRRRSRQTTGRDVA